MAIFKEKKAIWARVLSLLICVALSIGQPVLIINAAPEEGQETVVFDLLTDGVKDPEAVDPGTPQFSWKITAGQRGTMQEAYQIVVTEEHSSAQIWDSGKVESSSSSGVLYAGPELTSDTPYLWQVKIWTNHGEVSDYSETASFRIGLGKEDWTADYIWEPQQGGRDKENNYAYFRKNFEITKPVKDAVVYTSAHNDYQLYLNGSEVGVGPARSDPYTYGQYCAYDVTEALQSGENAFAALAHWHGVWSNSGVNASPAYILEARILYEDGTREVVKTDGSWKMYPDTPYIEENPVYFGHYGGARNRASVKYDAGREIERWNETDFDATAWENAEIVERSNYNLYAQLVTEQRENEREVPLSVTQEDGVWLVDFGKCLTGWPELKLHSNQSGDEIKVQYWEVERGWGDAGYDTYLAKGGEETFYAPYVRHTSFRILEITGYEGELSADDVRGIVAYSYADKQGTFESSDQRLNDVYTMSERSGRQNIQQGLISVDANREQSPWTADSWNIGIGYLYNHKDSMIIDKVIKDYAGEQLPSGNFLTCSPARDYHSEMIEWSLYWPMLLWEQYLFAGSEKLLTDYYPNLTAFTNYLDKFRDSGTGLYNPGGWRASDYAGGSLQNGGDNIATNSQIYRVFEISAEIARITGNIEDSEHYSQRAGEVKTGINSVLLVNGEKYKTNSGNAQTHPLGTAWALRFDIVPRAFKERVTKWMAGQSDKYDVGGYGGDALYNGLYTAGLGAVATKDFDRYDQMLATNNTIWESFGELSIDNMGNHAWTAYPSYLLQKYVGGITPTAGGFAGFDIKPVTDGLEYAKAQVPTVKGMIETDWEIIDDANLSLQVEVPANTTARIYVPTNKMTEVTVSESSIPVYTEDGQAEIVPGLQGGAKDSGYVVFEAGSGSYSFIVTGTPEESQSDRESDYILDDGDARYSGDWTLEEAPKNDRYGDGFRYALWSDQITATAVYSVTVKYAGTYNVYGWWTVHPNRATNTPYTVSAGGEEETIRVNQETDGGQWNLLKSVELQAGETVTVQISNDANEYVIADAVRITQKDLSLEQAEDHIIDNDEAEFNGSWTTDTNSNAEDRYGSSFCHALPANPANASAAYRAAAEEGGTYYIYGWWGVHPNRADNTPYTIISGESEQTVRVNQEVDGGQWNLLGSVEAQAGDTITVRITNDANEYVIADAVRITKKNLDPGDPMTPFQELQLLLYSIYLPEAENCKDPALATAFYEIYEAAQQLCAGEDPGDEKAQQTIDALEKAIQDVLDNQKENLALNKEVTASDSEPASGSWSPAFVTDGIKTRGGLSKIGYTSNGFKGKEIEDPITLTVDLKEAKHLNQVILYPRMGSMSHSGGNPNFPENYEIQVSDDGVEFETVKTVTGQQNPMFQRVVCQFPRVSARYVRLSVTRLGDAAADEGGELTGVHRLQISELEIFNEEEFYDVTVLFNPDGGTISGTTEDIPEGTETVLTAAVNAGYEFRGWYMDEEKLTQELTCRLLMDSDKVVSARFFKLADQEEIEQLLTDAEGIDTKLYTAESVAVFEAAKTLAQETAQNPDATQEQVGEALEALKAAMNGLTERPVEVDKQALMKLLGQANLIKTDEYTDVTVQLFQTAKRAAERVYGNPDATQEQVDAALNALQKAINGLKKEQNETVRVSAVQLNKTNLTLKKGSKYTLKATVLPANAADKTITWKSSQSDLVSVDNNGVVKALKPGRTTITVTTRDGSKKASCSVTVEQPVTKLAFKTPGYTVTKKGQKINLKKHLTITPKDASDKSLTWKSSNKKIATVDKNGVVRFKARKGKVTITVTAKDGSRKKAKITLIYGKKISKIKMNKSKLSLKRGKTYKLKATITKPKKPAYKKIVWSSSNPKVVKVDNKGKIKALRKGKATITALAGDGSGRKAKAKVTVK